MLNIGIQVLRAKLRGFQTSGHSIARRISRSEKDRRYRLWDSKRRLGSYCRYHLVAYGLLRGIPYSQIERCAASNRLDVVYLTRVMQEHGGSEWTQEKVMGLLAEGKR